MRAVKRDEFTGTLRLVEFMRLIPTDSGYLLAPTRVSHTGDLIHREQTPRLTSLPDFSLADFSTQEYCTCWLTQNEPCTHNRKE